MKSKKSKLLLISWILGAIYAVYIVSYFFSATMNQGDASSAIGAGIATAIVAPHMLCTILAVIFNIIGWALNARWSALVGAILYAVAIVVFIMYAPFIIIQMILSFVGFAKMKKFTQAQSPDKIAHGQ